MSQDKDTGPKQTTLDAVEALRVVLGGRLKARVVTLSEMIEVLGVEGEPERDALVAARRLAHQLRGAGGTFNYPEITRWGGHVEAALLRVEDGSEVLTPTLRSELLAALAEALRAFEPG